jgi:processive 1,2-diacylglycerol beta-glucosyltransferase
VIKLFDVASGAQIGTLTEAQLQFLIDQLEEESDDDRDYYINAETLDIFAEAGADQALLDLLRNALGNRSEMDVRWEQ